MAARSHLLDVYGVHLHVATDRRQLAALRRRFGVKRIAHLDPDANEYGATTRFNNQPEDGPSETHFAFFIDTAAHRGNQGELLDTCAHEATHGGGLILDNIGDTYDGNSEQLAYLVGWLTRWLWSAATETK